MAELWQALGCGAKTHLRVLTDGDRGMEHFVQRSAPGSTGHVLDWFHIAMRLQAIRRSLGWSLLRAGYRKKEIRSEERALSIRTTSGTAISISQSATSRTCASVCDKARGVSPERPANVPRVA